MSRERSRCPTSSDLSRAFSVGAGMELQAHLAVCPRCAADWADLERLVALGRELPESQPTAQRREEVRTTLLASAGIPAQRAVPRRRRAWAVGAVLLVASAALAGLLLALAFGDGGARTRPSTLRAVLHPQPNARWTRVGERPDEIVRLMDGALTVEVQPLRPGERFRIITGDAEVEVRGTIFDVAVAEDRLVAVRVFRGSVEVRPVRAPRIVLAAGQRWDAPTTIAQAPPTMAECPGGEGAKAAVPAEPFPLSTLPAEVPPASVSIAPSSLDPGSRPLATREVGAAGVAATVPTAESDPGAAAGVAAPTPAESAFDEGWAAMRIGDHLAAVDAFARAETAAGADALAEDAAFWHAVALGRAGRDAEAGHVLVGFLERFSWSPRAGEASAMLGWILLDAGDVNGAAARFRTAAGDAVPAVRESARRGLEAVESARGSR